jgi:hypothetical protein
VKGSGLFLAVIVMGGGLVGLLAGGGYGFASGGAGGAFAYGGVGFGMGLVVGSIVGTAWLVLVTLLNWGKLDGPAMDYDDRPPSGRPDR